MRRKKPQQQLKMFPPISWLQNSEAALGITAYLSPVPIRRNGRDSLFATLLVLQLSKKFSSLRSDRNTTKVLIISYTQQLHRNLAVGRQATHTSQFFPEHY